MLRAVRSTPETHYARSGGLSIAFQDVGHGVPVVWVPGMISHVELQREIPCLGGFAERLERFARLVVFDKRGVGLSDRALGAGTLEDRMDDIRAVFDACGLERAALVGVSEGGPLSLLFAATYPERVTHLVIYSSYSHNDGSRDELDELCATLEKSWGTGVLAGMAVQHCNERATEELARLERYSCTPTMAAARMRSDWALDVRGVLSTIRTPTLVLHNRDDPFIELESSRAIAEGIPGARFVELPGDFHASWQPDDYNELISHIQEFVTGHPAVPVNEVDRVLATVVFTDIVNSTVKASELGDHDWRSLLDEHDRVVRKELDRHRGREIQTTGDGFFAAFDGPGRAVRFALATVEAAHQLGIDVRVGLHTGECEARGNDLSGIAVHIGARVGCTGRTRRGAHDHHRAGSRGRIGSAVRGQGDTAAQRRTRPLESAGRDRRRKWPVEARGRCRWACGIADRARESKSTAASDARASEQSRC